MDAPPPIRPPSSPEGARLFSAHARPRRRLSRRVLLGLGGGLVLAAAGGAALFLALNSDAARQEVKRQLHERLPESVAHFELGDAYAVDWSLRVRLGPLKVSSRPGASPWLVVDEILVRPTYWALLHGKARPARITLTGVRVDAATLRGDVERLLGRLRDRPEKEPRRASGEEEAATVAVVFDGVTLGRTGKDGWKTLYGPVDAELRYTRDGAERSVKGRASLPGDGTLRVEAQLAKGAPLSAELWAESLSLAALPDFLASRLPVRVERGTVEGHLRAEAPADFATASVEGTVALRGGFFSGERLAPEPVGPVDVAAEGKLSWERATKKVSLAQGRLSVGKDALVRVGVAGEVAFTGARPFRLDVRAEPVAYPALLAALPPQLVPGKEVPRPDGALGATALLAGELDKPAAWRVEVKLDLNGLKKAARAEPSSLAGSFSYQPQEAVGQPRQIQVGEQNPNFIPFEALPAHVYRAVTLSEDRGFFFHQGFEFLEIRDSLVEAAEKKRLRGASTITQQLAKNLYLSRERTYARKAREALVTVLLEASLPKARLMEIYLNIIEWGPGIYGLGEASRYYFGVDPRQLSVKQAAYLATIIPSPVRTHVFFEKGAINEVWEERIHTLLVRLRDDDIITEEQFQQSETEPLLFRARSTEGDGAAPAAP